MAQEQTTTLSQLRNPPAAASEHLPVSVSMDTVQGFEAMQRIAKLFASSEIIPKRFRQNMPSCFIAVDMAVRMGANPLLVMQNLYDVHGSPSWSAKFLIATFNKCGRFSAIRYAFQGKEGTDEWGCRALSKELATGEEIAGPLITIGLAKSEGWYGKSGSKWQTIPELMLRYRAAAWMVNTYAPEIAMGLQTVEEVQDTYDMELAPSGGYQITTDEIRHNASEIAPEDAPVEKATSRGRRNTSANEEPVEPDPTGEGEGETGEAVDLSYIITCPNTNKDVDERECAAKPCRPDCPAFE